MSLLLLSRRKIGKGRRELDKSHEAERKGGGVGESRQWPTAAPARARLMLQLGQGKAPWWQGLGCTSLQPDLPPSQSQSCAACAGGSSAAPLPPAPALCCRRGKPLLCHELPGLSPALQSVGQTAFTAVPPALSPVRAAGHLSTLPRPHCGKMGLGM